MKNKILYVMAALVMLSLTLGGCKKKEDENGYLKVNLTDAPGNYLHVYVDIQRVDVHYTGGDWTTLSTNAGVYDLLTLQNNVTAVLVNNAQLHTGKITQMRLILGTNNSVTLKSDSSVHPLTIPSSYNTGIKINVDMTIASAGATVITLDYDADASINLTGSNEYVMNPVVKVK